MTACLQRSWLCIGGFSWYRLSVLSWGTGSYTVCIYIPVLSLKLSISDSWDLPVGGSTLAHDWGPGVNPFSRLCDIHTESLKPQQALVIRDAK